jgi:DNA topoisomerase I
MISDVEVLLEEADLQYVSTDEPGLTRQRSGRGFTYKDVSGKTIRDKKLRKWIESIVIPPAWEEVWISPIKNGHILATGRDNKGRKQYRYHPRWDQIRDQNKFSVLSDFGRALPEIRRITGEHLRQRTLNRHKVLAAVVRLLEETMIRIGNREYARDNDSYGLTTLEDDHVSVEGSKVHFEFTGKSGIEHAIEFRDKRLAKVVQECQDIPGQHLFQYYDEDGQRHGVGSQDVNAYLQEITGQPFTAKVFRTWGGSSAAIRYLTENCADSDGDEAAADAICKKHINECVSYVSDALGNTKTVCRKYYIHPAVLTAFEKGELFDIFNRQKAAKSDNDLRIEEAALVDILELEAKATSVKAAST